MIGITGTVRWRNQASATCAMLRPVCAETAFTAEMIQPNLALQQIYVVCEHVTSPGGEPWRVFAPSANAGVRRRGGDNSSQQTPLQFVLTTTSSLYAGQLLV